MTVRSAHFRSVVDEAGSRCRFVPGPRAGSGWGSDHMRGMAVSGALARTAERELVARGRDELQVVRWTLDLFRPTRMRDVEVVAAVVREGRRYCVIDAVAAQGGEPTARATAAFAAPGDDASRIRASRVWTDPMIPSPPDWDGADEPDHVDRLYWDEGRGWLPYGTPLYTGSRKALWHLNVPIVDGETPSPFVSVASIADVVNAATSVGPDGLAFINTDATMHLSRLPSGGAVGMSTITRTEHAGLAAATAVLFDRDGLLGQVSATGMASRPIGLLGHPLPAAPGSL